jgi:hypothetical protein
LAARFAYEHLGHIGVKGLQMALAVLLMLFAWALGAWAFPVTSLWVWVVFGLLAGWALYGVAQGQWLVACLFAVLSANWMLNSSTYPQLMQYQSTSVSGKEIKALKPETVISIFARGHALDYYAQRIVPYFESVPTELQPGTFIFTNQPGLDLLYAQGVQYDILQAYPHYKVTALTWGFINPTTRWEKVHERYLIRVL